MKIRSVGLFVLVFGLAGTLVPATPPTRLFEIFSQRFITDTSGQPILDLGRLTAEGEFKHYIYMQLSATTKVPAEAMNKNLLPFSIFPAYDVLGPVALANFRVDGTVNVSGQDYFVMAVVDKPKLDVGNVLNLSSRGVVAPGGEPLVGGFVVDDHSRHVLLRAVGPTLSSFGVGAPLANPVITLFRQGEATGFATNDDWGQQSNAGEIESAATSVGAFPLARTSKDAALLIELPPGVYSAQVTSRDSTGGTALLEIYMLP